MKRLLLISSLVLVCSTSIPVMAYSDIKNNIDNTENLKWDVYDPLSWNQYNSAEMPQSWLKDRMLDGSSGVSFPEGGDFIYVYTFLALKTGFKMPGYTPSAANADLEYYHAYANGLPHLGAEGIFPNDWKADLTSEGSQYQPNKSLEDIKKIWFEGKLVVMQVKNDDYEQNGGSHFIALDYIDTRKNEFYIFDSTKPAVRFSDVYSNDDILSIISISSSKNNSYELPSLYSKRGSMNLFSKTGERDPSTLGGGGAHMTEEQLAASKSEKKETAEETTKVTKTNQFENDAPNQDEESSKEEEKNEEQHIQLGWNLIPLILGLGGIGVFVWKRRQNKDY